MSIGFRIVTPSPELVSDLWRRFYKAHHGFAYALSIREFVAMMTSEDTAIAIIGDYGGVVLLTNIVAKDNQSTMIEPRASVHALYWDKSIMGQPMIGTSLSLHAMERWGLHRLIAEIPMGNKLAAAYVRRVGFHEVGTLRKRLLVRNKWYDAVVYDALPDDLLAVHRRGEHGRHRGLRSEVHRQAG